MKISSHRIKVRDIVNGYVNNDEEGVIGYGGKLNIRPAYQREFVYDVPKRNAVIDTIIHGYPLNVMYWAINDDGNYELLDGQQRTLSFCEYCANQFSINERAFKNLTQAEQNEILDYELMIYICKGNDKQKLDWFRIINIASEPLTEQELRNAIYTGTWLNDAKRWFSKTKCPAYQIGADYLKGNAIRQDYLETVLKWITDIDNSKIENYMSIHQHDVDAKLLWEYFKNIIEWVEMVFPVKRKKIMQGVEWGILYNKYHEKRYNPRELEKDIQELLQDDFVTNQKGIYEYLLSNKEKQNCLSIRTFREREKQIMYERQKGECPVCRKKGRSIVDKNHPKTDAHWEIEEMQADHIKAWSKYGLTLLDNCQMLCAIHNNEKSDK